MTPGNKRDLSSRIWQFFSSMRFALVLVLALAGILALDTLYGGGHNIYATLWFRLLVGLLCMNLVVCSANRISTLAGKKTAPAKDDLSGLPLYYTTEINTGRDQAEDYIHSFFRSRRYRVQKTSRGPATVFHLDRGNAAPWFSLVLHFSLVLVIAGFAWSGMGSYQTRLTLPEGYTGQIKGAPEQFSVRLEDFNTVYDSDGNVDNWVSELTVLSGDGEVLREGEAKVNHPLYFRGYNLYQHSYGKALRFELTDSSGATTRSMLLAQEQYYPDLPRLQLQVGSYEQGRVPYELYREERRLAGGYISPGESVNIPEREEKLKFAKPVPLSVIEIKKDPGVPLVFTGLALTAASFFLVLFTRQRQYWARVESQGDNTCTLSLGGLKGKRGFSAEEEFNQLTGELAGMLQENGRN